MNVDKTEVVHFYKGWRGQAVQRYTDIRVGGKLVDVVNEFKYLGVTVDNLLKFTKQIESNIRKGTFLSTLFVQWLIKQEKSGMYYHHIFAVLNPEKPSMY